MHHSYTRSPSLAPLRGLHGDDPGRRALRRHAGARAIVALAGLVLSAAATPALAQCPVVVYTVDWNDNGNGNGNGNGRLEAGEAACIAVSVRVSPAVGGTIAYTIPAPPGTGTVAGLGTLIFSITAPAAVPHTGTWTLSGGAGSACPLGRVAAFSTGPNGVAQANGDLLNINCGQFPLPPNVANATNPINNIWRGKWQPGNLNPRIVRFSLVPGAAAGGNHSSILIRYGTGASGQPLYTNQFVSGAFAWFDIPIGALQPCPANCDLSLNVPTLTVNDFICFSNAFAAGHPYANCDDSTCPPLLTVNDFVCFLNRFSAGCP